MQYYMTFVDKELRLCCSDKSSDVLDGFFFNFISHFTIYNGMIGEITAFVLCNIIVIRLMGDLSVPTFFLSRQKNNTNMRKNCVWPWIRRVHCVPSFHCCKSWIISDVKLKIGDWWFWIFIFYVKNSGLFLEDMFQKDFLE